MIVKVQDNLRRSPLLYTFAQVASSKAGSKALGTAANSMIWFCENRRSNDDVADMLIWSAFFSPMNRMASSTAFCTSVSSVTQAQSFTCCSRPGGGTLCQVIFVSPQSEFW